MRKILIIFLLALALFAENPFQPVRRGTFLPEARPGEFAIGFWDRGPFDPLYESPPLPPELIIPSDGCDP